MKKLLVLSIMIVTLILSGCGLSGSNANSLAKNTYEFVSVSTKGDTLTAAQMNGIGAAHPTVSFTDKEMNLFYVMQYPVIEYSFVSDGKYNLTIEKEEGGKEEIGTITVNSNNQIQIDFSIQGVSQTYIFQPTEQNE